MYHHLSGLPMVECKEILSYMPYILAYKSGFESENSDKCWGSDLKMRHVLRKNITAPNICLDPLMPLLNYPYEATIKKMCVSPHPVSNFCRWVGR